MIFDKNIKFGFNNRTIQCNECYTENTSNSRFCTVCGAVFCPDCSSSNPIEANFCLECGYKLEEITYVAKQKGMIFFQRENYKDALKCFEKVLIREPANFKLLYKAAKSAYYLSQFDLALMYCNEGLKINPYHKKFLYEKGIIYENLKNYREASNCFSEIIGINYTTGSRPPEHINQQNLSFYEKKETIEYRLYSNLKKMIIDTGNYHYLENFIIKFNGNYNKAESEKLATLLISRGSNISPPETELLLKYESDFMMYQSFKHVIMRSNPQNINDYFHNLMDYFGEYSINWENQFLKLMHERGIVISHEEFTATLTEIKRQKEIENFEKSLNENSRQINIHDVDGMSGRDFEIFLSNVFERKGYKVRLTPETGDQGADIILEKFGEITVVQAKNYSQTVGNSAVQQVVGSIKHYNAHRAMVVTNNYFTKSARELASSNGVILIDREKLLEWL